MEEFVEKRNIRKEIKDRVGLDVSKKQYDVFLREYNNFEMPLSERINTIDIEKFIDYIFERTDIPICGNN